MRLMCQPTAPVLGGRGQRVTLKKLDVWPHEWRQEL